MILFQVHQSAIMQLDKKILTYLLDISVKIIVNEHIYTAYT